MKRVSWSSTVDLQTGLMGLVFSKNLTVATWRGEDERGLNLKVVPLLSHFLRQALHYHRRFQLPDCFLVLPDLVASTQGPGENVLDTEEETAAKWTAHVFL